MMHATQSDNPITKEQRDRFLSRQSVIEMRARERARALLDPGTFRELLCPFDRLESPWLPLQGIVPQSDDGVIIARGQLAGRPAVIMAIEGAFQGGGMGEVSASKRLISARPWSPRSMPKSSRFAAMCRSLASSPAWSVVSAACRSPPACA